MKCDELVSYGMDDNAIGEEYEMYKVADVDAAIAELKAENERLKAKLENVQASMYADVVDANMEIRRLKEELRHNKYKRCLAMARWCHSMWILLRDENETKRSVFYWRWWNLWNELADKFKEAK